MAIFIDIIKTQEDDSYAYYKFGPNQEDPENHNKIGMMKINKTTGDITCLSEVPGDTKQNFSVCVRHKLFMLFKNNEYPDKTIFAA